MEVVNNIWQGRCNGVCGNRTKDHGTGEKRKMELKRKGVLGSVEESEEKTMREIKRMDVLCSIWRVDERQ